MKTFPNTVSFYHIIREQGFLMVCMPGYPLGFCLQGANFIVSGSLFNNFAEKLK